MGPQQVFFCDGCHRDPKKIIYFNEFYENAIYAAVFGTANYDYFHLRLSDFCVSSLKIPQSHVITADEPPGLMALKERFTHVACPIYCHG